MIEHPMTALDAPATPVRATPWRQVGEGKCQCWERVNVRGKREVMSCAAHSRQDGGVHPGLDTVTP